MGGVCLLKTGYGAIEYDFFHSAGAVGGKFCAYAARKCESGTMNLLSVWKYLLLMG